MRVLFSLVMTVLLAGFAFAEIPITDMVDMDLNMRPRLIIDGRDFDTDTGLADTGDLRTMIGISVMPNEKVLIRVKLRETRFLGTQGTLAADFNHFEGQEAYAKLMGLFDKPVCFTVGRFEWEHGRGRLIGATGWSAFGPRTWDGVHIGFKPSYGFWELAVIRLAESGLADEHLIVLSGSLFDNAFKPIFAADVDNVDYGFEDRNRVYTAGFYYHRMLGEAVAFMMDGAYQFGKLADNDVGAYMVALDVYYKFKGRLNPFIGVGVDMTSGNEYDAVLADDGDAQFRSPFYTGHAFRGWMDYFVGTQYAGLNDFIFHFGFKPENGVKFIVNAHMFNWANPVLINPADPSEGDYTAIGNEIDVKVIVPANENMKFECGYGMFMPSDDFVPDGDNSSWGYLSSIITF